MAVQVRQRGGEWTLSSPAASEIFTAEDLNEAQRQIGQTVRDFVRGEVWPALPAMEAHDFDQAVRLMRQAGELGMLGIEVPEEFGGLGLDGVTAAVATEAMGAAGSFSVTWAAHAGIGTLPIVYFGDRAQKQKYLADLASGRKIAAYALTESGSGSDALAARTTARLEGDRWILNGSKQWITNSGFADLFVVYAQLDGQVTSGARSGFSAFLVDRDSPGLSVGKEEHKMGIRGSSTRALILENCAIPRENLLHEPGKGHQIAFNILNVGRFKLGAATLGGSKHLIGIATGYALQRRQFGKALAEFRLIQQKLADMAVRTYAVESAVYRAAALLSESVAAVDHAAARTGDQSVPALQEYAVECSIMKVLGSELLDFVVDEAVQIHGGYGFMEEFEVCRAYRDSRINRIFEGTNEINRLLITGDLFRRAMRGQLPLMPALGGLQAELLTLTPPSVADEGWLVEATRKIALMVAGLAAQKHGTALESEQELLAGVSDMLMDLYAMESALLRAEKHPSEARRDLATAFVHDAFDRVEDTARRLLAALEEGDALRTQLAVLRKLTRREPINVLGLKRRIAARVIEARGYTA
ncbi:MAG TPA: acyl-CoA dehydrogenase family protein [Chloroflexota bacterium]|jgi:alkylation response protein AidB-like acyl-CoA dehydrogenase|nr:acyl-CoA dehydrogenase family protein [Chloroflexota bacterium]